MISITTLYRRERLRVRLWHSDHSHNIWGWSQAYRITCTVASLVMHTVKKCNLYPISTNMCHLLTLLLRKLNASLQSIQVGLCNIKSWLTSRIRKLINYEDVLMNFLFLFMNSSFILIYYICLDWKGAILMHKKTTVLLHFVFRLTVVLPTPVIG